MKVNLKYIKESLLLENVDNLKIIKDEYPNVIVNKDNTKLIDKNGNEIGTKGDMYHKLIFDKILREGCIDKNPRPKYEDGTPAHTLSINHGMLTYDLSKGENPLITLRPIAIKSSIGEILWIYQDESNNLDTLKNKYNITWWDDWDLGNRTIGSCYGQTVKNHNLIKKLLKVIKENPDGRRHIINLWQDNDFVKPHGLKPCAFLTEWNVRHGRDGIDYLDMMLTQRSSDFATAGCINQIQYVVLLMMIARHLGYTPGKFSWSYNNIQIYDRHINQVIEMLNREPINCNPKIILNPNKNNFYDFTIDDIKVVDYPKDEIKTKNKQLKFPLGI